MDLYFSWALKVSYSQLSKDMSLVVYIILMCATRAMLFPAGVFWDLATYMYMTSGDNASSVVCLH